MILPSSQTARALKPDKAAGFPRIFEVRGMQVIVDSDLAACYETTTFRLNETVKRNIERFPEDFCFQLTQKEWANLISQFAISSFQPIDSKRKNTSKSDNYGGRRTLPYVFTEHGVTMVAGLLRSPKAVALSIHIVREFIRLRRADISYAELNDRMNRIEARLGDEVKDIWEVLHHMLMQPEPEILFALPLRCLSAKTYWIYSRECLKERHDRRSGRPEKQT